MMDHFTALWRKLRGLDVEDPQKDQEYRVIQADEPYSNVPDYPASTFIKNIRYRPSERKAYVTMGNKVYWYPMTEMQMVRWLRSPSLGQWYNLHMKLKK